MKNKVNEFLRNLGSGSSIDLSDEFFESLNFIVKINSSEKTIIEKVDMNSDTKYDCNDINIINDDVEYDKCIKYNMNEGNDNNDNANDTDDDNNDNNNNNNNNNGNINDCNDDNNNNN